MNAKPVIDWLMEADDPPLKYRVLRDLLDLPEGDPAVAAARRGIPESAAARQVLGGMHPGGYWLQVKPTTGEMIGDGVEYGAFATTHFCLAYLAELGLDRSHPQVAQAAERYLALQQPDGDWYGHFSCLYGYNIRTFIRLGYGADERVQRSAGLLDASGRYDGGYLCEIHERPAARKKPKSCVRGSLKALAAYAELGPAYWDHPACINLVDYFLSRGGVFQREHPGVLVNKDMDRLLFPFHWRASVIELLYALSRMGLGNDPRLEPAWVLLASKAGADGRFPLDWTPAQCPWKVGKRGRPNRWVTFYALLAMKTAGRLN